LLGRHDILVTNKPVKTLQQELPAPKFCPEKEDQCNVVYKIPYSTCSWSYIGETGWSFNTRKKEHTRNVKVHTKGSNVANHAWSKNHQIDFDNALIVDKAYYRQLKTLESWRTAKTVYADNNSCPLPNQYCIQPRPQGLLLVQNGGRRNPWPRLLKCSTNPLANHRRMHREN